MSYKKKYKLTSNSSNKPKPLNYMPILFTLDDTNKRFLIDHKTLGISSNNPIRNISIYVVYSYTDKNITGTLSEPPNNIKNDQPKQGRETTCEQEPP